MNLINNTPMRAHPLLPSKVSIIVLSLVVLGGCKKASDNPVFPDVFSDTLIPAGAGIGGDCATPTDCRPGLDCGGGGTCEPGHSQIVGQDCIISAECLDTAYCAPITACFGEKTFKDDSNCKSSADCNAEDPTAQCIPSPNTSTHFSCKKAGAGEPNTVCDDDGDCLPGLFCNRVTGLVGICAEGGSKDIGLACETSKDCYAGLVCGPGEECMGVFQAIQLAAKEWDGVDCDADDTKNPRIYLEVPRGKPLAEFYRLPFPNDIRIGGGKLMEGHAVPGRGPVDFDPVERILEAANDGLQGFGTSPTVFIRMSAPLNFDSVDYTHDDTDPNLRLVNVDPDSPQYKQPKGYVWAASSGAQKYICNNWVTVRNHASDPLEDGTTYAVILLKGMKVCGESDDGCADAGEFGADDDMVTLLSATRPNDAFMSEAWDKYANLRQYLEDEGIPKTDVIGATVFTTVNTQSVISKVRGGIQGATPPVLKDVTVCGEGVVSPCADPDGDGPIETEAKRECGTDSAFTEIHGTIVLPIYQDGTPPYLEPKDGGGIKLGPGGVPQLVRSEEVCFSLTIPKATAPAEGFPLVFYGHGTGGTFRSQVADGTANLLALAEANAGGPGIITMGIDGVAHGTRRGAIPIDPETLFFNFANPRAARGNVFQAGIDFFSLVRWAQTHTGTVAGVDVAIDKTRMGYLGHSQGATTGPVFLAYEPAIGPVILSGAGAGLIESLLNKKSPADVSGGISLILRDTPSATHPVLSLMQQYFDPVDAANYGRMLTKTPVIDPPHDLLVIYGSGDTYTPPQTTRLLADVLGLNMVAPAIDTGPLEAFEGYAAGPDQDPEEDRIVDPPVSADTIVGTTPVTLGLLGYTPAEGRDGHFVLFDNATAKTQAREFFATKFKTGTATIVAP